MDDATRARLTTAIVLVVDAWADSPAMLLSHLVPDLLAAIAPEWDPMVAENERLRTELARHRPWKWWCSATGTLTYESSCEHGPHKLVLVEEPAPIVDQETP